MPGKRAFEAFANSLRCGCQHQVADAPLDGFVQHGPRRLLAPLDRLNLRSESVPISHDRSLSTSWYSVDYVKRWLWSNCGHGGPRPLGVSKQSQNASCGQRGGGVLMLVACLFPEVNGCPGGTNSLSSAVCESRGALHLQTAYFQCYSRI